MVGVSVVICCYNSANLLPATMKHIAMQHVSASLMWELIIVNNNSTDNTGEVATLEWQANGSPATLLVIDEVIPGLSNARAEGIKKSKYDIIIFCDDDNWLDNNYIQLAYDIMQSNPAIGILGGLNSAVSSIELPNWFSKFMVSYACGPQAETDGEISADRLFIAGAGMVIRKEIFAVLDRIGFQSMLTDRKGEELSSGGDAEVCITAVMLGYKLFYSSKLKLNHFLEPRRLNWVYLLKMIRGQAKATYKMIFYKKVLNNEELPSNWLVYFFNRSRTIFNREVVFNLSSNFINGHRSVGNTDVVHRIWDFEIWNAHMNMMGSYSEFTSALMDLKAKAAAFKSQNNS